MKHAIGPRREIGVRTVFNLLGPLTNPAGVKHQVIGVFAAGWTEPLARTLGQLGSKHALVVHGLDGLDEISTTGPTRVSEMRNGETYTYEVTPFQFGLSSVPTDALRVKTAQESAGLIRDILDGREGPPADIACLNAGAAIYAADAAKSIQKGIELARQSIRSGAAKDALAKLAAVSRTK
jgi:anthranilate phosphoribosyltransferase